MFHRLKKNLFVTYALSYAAILLIPATLTLGLSVRQLSEMQKQAYSASRSVVEQSASSIDNRFAELFKTVQVISASDNMSGVLREPESFYARYRLYKDLQNHCYSNTMVQSIYILLDDRDIVMGSDGVITNFQQFFQMKYDLGEEHYGQWLQEQSGALPNEGRITLTEIWGSSGRVETVLYVQPLIGTGQSVSQRGRVLFYLSIEQLGALVADSGEIERFSLSMPGAGNDIPLLHKDLAPEGERVRIEMTSDTGKVYTGVFLESALLTEWYRQLLISVGFIAATGLVGGVLCIWFARRNSMPIHNLVSQIEKTAGEEERGDQGVFDYLQGSLSQLLSDKEFLGKELERRLPMLQVGFVERLLVGNISSISDVQEQAEDLGIRLKGESYCVAIFRVTSYGRELEETARAESPYRVVLESVIRRLAGGNLYIYGSQPSLTTVIFALSGRQQREGWLEGVVVQIIEEVVQTHQFRVQAAIGLPYASLADLSLSHSQAHRALDACAGEPDRGLFLYRREPRSTLFYYFPPELELKLIRNASAGNPEQVEAVFNEIYQENIHNATLSPTMYRGLISELNGAYRKTLSYLREREVSTDLLEEKLHQEPVGPDWDELELLHKLFGEIALLMEHRKRHQDSQMKERIQCYMREHYQDINMSLAMISDHFAVSEVHMSRLFKEHVGINFTQYLEQVRMECADDLLQKSSKSVADIALACGYASAHTFRRAYKRYHGYLPSDVRRNG